MCNCGTNQPPRPSQTQGSGASGRGGSSQCGGTSASAILLIDELGLPLVNVSVRVTIGGVSSTMTSDGSGNLCFTQPPGTMVQVQLADMHEAQPGESTTDSSGHHFRANGNGP